jgi:hypothetical protein
MAVDAAAATHEEVGEKLGEGVTSRLGKQEQQQQIQNLKEIPRATAGTNCSWHQGEQPGSCRRRHPSPRHSLGRP